MSKYTKRQYLADVTANQAAIEVNSEELVRFNDRLEAGEPIDSLSDAWNAAHDREWELEQERHDIERRWSRRNWTWQDHSEHELVAANID